MSIAFDDPEMTGTIPGVVPSVETTTTAKEKNHV